MEHNGGNQQNLSHSQCRTGCGFYASASFDGMCSKCYRDSVKRRQQNPSPSPLQMTSSANSVYPATSVADAVSPVAAAVQASSSITRTPVDALRTLCTPAPIPVDLISTTPSVETATPTVPTASSTPDDKDDILNASADAASADIDATDGASSACSSPCSPGESEDGKKKKKNRCHTCKKKVGLTGFKCRCEGLYCSTHRYSDKHDCTFNYKELAQKQIRKNNPVVVGEKIQKI